jgi:hypothetical protein
VGDLSSGCLLSDFVFRDVISVMGNLRDRTEVNFGERSADDFFAGSLGKCFRKKSFSV